MPSDPAVAPAPGRYRILALLCLLAMITYLDRVCFGVAAATIAADLGYGDVSDLKYAVTAFALAYAVFEITSGWIGDVWGPRSTLIRIVLVWSACTAMTGLVGWTISGVTLGGLGALTLVRFLFGAGEAGAFPNITRAMHNWFPPGEWSTAQGCIWMSGRIMGGFTPLIWTWLTAPNGNTPPLVTWRGAFLCFGAIGLAWCTVFAFTFRDHPDVSSSSSEPVEAESHSVPWSALFRSTNMWLICAMYFGTSYGWYFNITYLPNYLEQKFGVLNSDWLGAIYKGGPLLIGAVGCIIGGTLGDRLGRRWNNRGRARLTLGIVGHSCAAACWLLAPAAKSAFPFFLAVSLTAFFNDLTLASAWSTCQDVGRRYTAICAAWMNTVGTLGAAAAGWITGWLAEMAIHERALALHMPLDALSQDFKKQAALPGYEYSFYTYAIVYAVTAFLWTRIDPTKPIVSDGEALGSG
jgi:MFS family permease